MPAVGQFASGSDGRQVPLTTVQQPAAWTIVEDELYLNYSKDVQTQWSHDIPGNIAKADGNWPGIRDGLD